MTRRVIPSQKLPDLVCADAAVQRFINEQLRKHVAEVYQQFASLFGKPEFVAPTLLNSWVNIGGGYSTAGYYKDPLGRVHLKGGIKDGTLTQPAFTLPVECRPSERLWFSAIAFNGASYIVGALDIQTDGDVVPYIGDTEEFWLNGISFAAV
jgi:hypothetical protein